MRLLEPALLHQTLGSIEKFLETTRGCLDPAKLRGVRTFSKVIDLFQSEGIMKAEAREGEDRRVVDVTREAIKFPAPRSAVLQMLARADTGGLMCMGYSTIRGFAVTHGTIGELRVGEVPVRVTDPRGRRRYLGKIKVTECEMVGGATKRVQKKGPPRLSVGYGLCFGQNETKAICMGMVESALRTPDPSSPASNQEFVLYHTECVEGYGFTNHLKLPHYVTFQSQLDNLRKLVKTGEPVSEKVAPGGEAVNEDEDDE
jgi:alpha-D-ribose 1-methylphosphonate 5-triphosphate synthase subunit PhnI